VREWWMRLLAVGRRGRRDREFDDEMRFHVDQLAREFERRGFEPEPARAAAERELGGVGRTKQAWRDQRSWLPLDETVQDIRYGIRVLRRSKGLTLLAGVMLALAVAATTSLFTVVDAVLLAPLPYARAGQLAVVNEEYLTLHAPMVSVTPGTFLEWQARSHTFAAMTAIDQRDQNLISDGEPLQVNVGAVSHGFAATILRQPLTGRFFADAEFTPGQERVALIGHDLWSTRYGRAPVEGRAIVLDDQPYTIIGVMPAGFLFPTPRQQIWVPLPMTAADRANRTGHTLFVVARARDGVPLEVASRELHDIAAALRREFPESNREWGVTVTPAREAMVGETSGVLRAMMGAVALLLLVACSNVAGLLLTHGVTRSRELAVRAAIGASRLRIVRQLLTESVLLAATSAVAGVLLAWFGQPLLASLRPADLLTWKPIALDARALAFAAAAALGSGVLFGTLPAFAASRANLAATASERSGRGAFRIRQMLVGAEVALALVLVAGAAILAQTLARLTAVDPGFRADRIVTVRVSLPTSRYKDDARVNRFYRTLLDRIRSTPGIRAAGAIQALPLSGNTSVRPYHVDGAPILNPPPLAHYRIVTPGYFEAMRIPLHAGRTFTDLDTADRPLAVIVNETLRRQGWGSRGPLGSRVTFGGGTPPDVKWAEVVGVVGDVRHFGAGTPPAPEMYWPAPQIDAVPGETLRRMRRGLTLVVATESDDSLSAVPTVRAAVLALDPEQPIANVRTMASLMDASMWLSRATAWLLTIFGGAALTFALLSVFGAASYAVQQRRRELALRLALGADPRRVARLAVRGAVAGALAGIAVGVGLAVMLSRAVETLIVGSRGADAVTLAVVGAGLAAAAAAASWIPARRAARIDPMQALRVE
jgi:putative ABC transport system permease protein